MASTPVPGPAAPNAPLRRDPTRRMLGGVCAGIAARMGVDPLWVRLAFVAGATAGGLGVAVYALAWAAIPVGEGATRPRAGWPEVAAPWRSRWARASCC